MNTQSESSGGNGKARGEAVGQPLSRTDGRAKVTGQARYTAEAPYPDLCHAFLVQSAIASGRVVQINTRYAERMPGVLAILTHKNMPRLNPAMVAIDNNQQQGGAGEDWLPLQDDKIHFSGQHLAVVIADTLEQARHAARQVQIEYAPTPPHSDVQAERRHQFTPTKVWGEETDKSYGDWHQGWREGVVRVEAVYNTAIQHHVTMEPHATVAAWEGDRLTLHETSSWVYGAQKTVATWLDIPPENVRVLAPFVGGSFGCKGPTWPHVALAAVAARKVGRPVRLELTRPQTFWSNGYRPQIEHRVALSATRDGKLTSLAHHANAQTAMFDDRVVAPVTKTSRKLYQCANVATSYRLTPLNMPGPFTMRGPGESPGLFALESAMDELAYALNMDPIELRLRNYAETDPEEDQPWTSKSLRECYEQGAARFGWRSRNPRIGSMKAQDGETLIGWGMASMAYDAKSAPAKAHAQIYADGRVVVQSATCDQGTGSYTIMRQIAADALGVSIENVVFELGDTRMPLAPISAGSMTAASVGSSVQGACHALRDKLIGLARANRESPLHNQHEESITLRDGRLFVTSEPTRGESVSALLRRLGLDWVEATEEVDAAKASKGKTRYSFGAHFAEVQINPHSGEARVTRYVAAFGAGRILNPKTARSQLLGGVVWGIGMALHEQTHLDMHLGRLMNHDLSEYHIPVNADIPAIDAFFVEEQDEQVNPLGVKGIGEIGTIGAAAAIANAVYHATGKRVRDLPITPDKLL